MPLSWKDIQVNAADFVKRWEGEKYEKGEAQTFYNEFFEVFGISRRRVARFEEHVKLQNLDKQSGFIDLLWPKVLIAEHKSLGADLGSAETQAGSYFDALHESIKPRYQLVCDFATFKLLDREGGRRVEFELAELPRHVANFAFMIGKHTSLRSKLHLNERAADLIARVHTDLIASRYPHRDLEIFLTRLVFCLFADDTAIFQPRGKFLDLLESRTDEDGRNLGQILSHLFDILNTPVSSRQEGLDSELADFPFLNGGLFSEHIRIPGLNRRIREDLLEACGFDWSEVSPAIFGALFENIFSSDERRAWGAYSTSEKNILRVLDDLFLRDLRTDLEQLLIPANRREGSLRTFQQKLSRLRFFDPACGCGNFMVVAYRELRRMELDALTALKELGQLGGDTAAISMLNVDQFYGIEQHTYSARIAEAAMWMTDHSANNELSLKLGLDFHRIPLEKIPHITRGKALEIDWSSLLEAKDCAYIFGNPPYKGAKQQSDRERQIIRELGQLGGSGGTLDYVCGWIIKSAEYAESGTRIGLVVTHSVTQGEQVGQLWPMLFENYGLEIEFAHQSFKWYFSGPRDSNVHVIILGLAHKGHQSTQKCLYEYDIVEGTPREKNCSSISPYLIAGDRLVNPHVVVRSSTNPINGLPEIGIGTKPIDGGYYILDDQERAALIEREPDIEQYIRPFVGTEEFLKGINRFLLVPSLIPPKDILRWKEVKSLVNKVKRYRKGEISNKSGTRKLRAPNELYRSPTRFHVTRLPTSPFLVIPEVTSERRTYVPIGWLEPPTVPSNLVKYTENATLSHFALLTSAMHMAWMKTIGGRLEGRYRYSIEIVYNNFPLPVRAESQRLESLAKSVLNARAEIGGSLESMYDVDTMPHELLQAHIALDREVDRMYLGHEAADDADRVVALLNLYSGSRIS